MTSRSLRRLLVALAVVIACGPAAGRAQSPDPPTISPADLAAALRGPAGRRPIVIQVGFRIMYDQAHIPGSEYVGPATSPSAIEQLRTRVAPLKRDASIVLYCGCCPWERCPNVRPAAALLSSMGFTNFRVLRIANNFGADWVDKGYPVQKGK